MTQNIRIDDLADPVLSEEQQSILEFGKTLNIELVAQEILQEAKAELSLEDFGDMGFLTRLELLCDEWGSDSDLNNLGRLNLRGKLLQFVKNRLLIQDLLNRHPEIHAIKINKPIIVAGLPRSGTTHLLNLMAADKRLRALPLWESYEPILAASETKIEGAYAAANDPRYQRCADAWEMMQATVPLIAAMHPMNPDHIHEELELMGPDFASYNFEWLCQCPRWRDHYYATDQTPHYEYMKTVLKILTWQDGDTSGENTRWVLKCPQHLEQLTVLQKVFPDATIAITHRDPVSVIQSACTMLAYGARMSRNRIDTQAILDYWSDRVAHLLEACAQDRNKLSQEQSIDVLFHEFMADDIAMVKKIYEKSSLSMTETALSQLNAFLSENKRGKHGQVIYNLEDDFGIAPSELRKRFQFYFDQFPVKAEA